MAQQQTTGGFFKDFTAGDAFDGLVKAYVGREEARAKDPKRTQKDQSQLIGAPDHVTQRPNARPSTPGATSVTAGSGQGAGSRRLNVAGVPMNRTGVIIAGTALAVAAGLYLRGA